MRSLGTLGVIAIPYLLLISIGFVVTTATQTPELIKLAPTFRFWLVAAILGIPYLFGFNVFERVLQRLCPAPKPWWRILLISWVAVLVTLGALNLLAAYVLDVSTYVNVKLFGLTGLFWAAGLILLFMHYGRRPQDQHVRA